MPELPMRYSNGFSTQHDDKISHDLLLIRDKSMMLGRQEKEFIKMVASTVTFDR